MIGLTGMTREIAREAGAPLHQQVSRALRGYIVASLQPNDTIPTEPELEVHFGVSRATIRRAVDDLVDEGLLARRQGAGTFVRGVKVSYEPAKLASWSESIRALGQTPRTRTMQRQEVTGPDWVRERLRLTSGEPVIWLWRLRLAGDEPMSVMVNYLPGRLVPGLAERGLMHESLYDELRMNYGFVPARAEDEVEAKLVTDDEAALLGVAPGSPLIEVCRTAYLADETPIEVSVVRSRADRYRYRATFVDPAVAGVRRPR
ncbi:MAG: GntR family transcriptional regulator [Thermomicrobiales bacterium]